MTNRSLAVLPAAGDEVVLPTYLHVREDELSLFGFESDAEKRAFEQLITVSGIGPKVALAVLSALSPDALATAIATEDVTLISSVPGIGKKTAQRLILELAGKLTPTGSTPLPGGSAKGAAIAEVTEALLAMGFSAAEVGTAITGYDAAHESDTQALLTHALKRLGGGS
jgi:Holliday junction DNA helicase RuvA